MIVFWTLVAAMLLVGMGWIIPPIVRPKQHQVSEREQQNIDIARERLRELENDLASNAIELEQFDRARREVEQILASDLGQSTDDTQPNSSEYSGIKSAMVVGICIPLLSIFMYGLLGNPAGLSAEPQRPTSAPANTDQMPSVDDMVNRLAERLKEEPNNPEGWRLLARSYSVMQRYPEAISALRRARGLVGDDPNLLIELADAVATVQNGSFDGEPGELVTKVLAANPQHPGGLWLAGRSAVVSRDFPLALKYWRQLEKVLPAEGEGVESVRLAIAKVKEASGKAGTNAKPVSETPAEKPKTTAAQSAGTGEIQVKVTLDPSLSSSVAPDDAVFVYAQALSGPPMPLAVTRKKVRDLPIQVTLNDSMAMMPAMALSKFPTVRVVARISKSGNAIPQSGDLKGQVEPVSVNQPEPVDIVILERIP